MQTEKLPRRSVLFALAASSVAPALAACSSSSTPMGSPDAGGGKDAGGGTDAGASADVMVLNGLLSDEYAAIAAYQAAAPYLSKPDKTDPGAALAPVVLQIALHFASQHQDHATALVAAIKALDGTPVSSSSVKFTPPKGFSLNVINILKLAANAERAAAVVYNQNVQTLRAATNRFLAAAISGDEAQHFIVLDAILAGVAQAGPALSTSTAKDVVPASFLASVGVGESLADVPDFDVTM